MSIPNTIPLSGLIAPNSYTDNYAVIDSMFSVGGQRELPLLVDRNTIAPALQRVGMVVYVDETQIYYSLVSTGSSILSYPVSNSFSSNATQYLTDANFNVFSTISGSVTASIINNGFTSSYLLSASYNIDSASFSSSIAVLQTLTASLALTASYALTSSYSLGNGIITPNIITVSSSTYIPKIIDYTIVVDATNNNVSINLPTASLSNRSLYNVKRIDSTNNSVFINSVNTDLIYGDNISTNISLYFLEAFTLHCDGNNNRWIAI